MNGDPAATAAEATEIKLLDVKGLRCPLPLLKAKQTLNAMPTGALLRVFATDPGSERDFEVFARQTGHALLDSGCDDGVYRYLLRKC